MWLSLPNFQREREILTILYRHGFGDLLAEMGGFRLFSWYSSPSDNSTPLGQRLCNLLEDLGPIYIKLGQILSTRLDLFPEEVLREFSKLQDRVRPLPFALIEQELARELQQPLESVFSHICEEPLGSASIAQVHAATLTSGESVVIKVRRPQILEHFQQDLQLWQKWIRRLSSRSQWLRSFSLEGIFEEFRRSLLLELDFRREARNTVRIAQNLSSYPWVRIPKIYWELTTDKVIVMEHLKGVKVSEYRGSRGGRRLLAQRGAQAVFHQVFIDGLFHSDPHPGNILILEREEIGFLDFGLVGRLDTTMRRHIFRLIQGILQQDADLLADSVLKICRFHGYLEEEDLFRRDLLEILDHFYGLPVKYIHFHHVLSELFALARRYNLHIPTEYTLVAKSLLTIEKIASSLDPDFHLIESLTQFLKEEVLPQKQEEGFQRMVQVATDFAEALEVLPGQIQRTLERLEKGQLSFELRHPRWEELTRQLERASKRISAGLILCALIIGSALIITSPHRGEYTLFGYDALGLLGFLFAGAIGILMALSSYR